MLNYRPNLNTVYTQVSKSSTLQYEGRLNHANATIPPVPFFTLPRVQKDRKAQFTMTILAYASTINYRICPHICKDTSSREALQNSFTV